VHLGRACVRFAGDAYGLATVAGMELEDGVVELELAVTGDRSFPGVAWRVRDETAYESFFVRPHQVGNPDAIQYTPVFNGLSAWQLYHGEGFSGPVEFPLGEWFTIRVVFAGTRARVFVADLATPALEVRELLRGPGAGGVGILVGGEELRVASFSAGPAGERLPEQPPPPAVPGIVASWSVSDPFPADALGAALDPAFLAARTWRQLAAEPSGLANLSRVNALDGERDTCLARTTIRAGRAETRELRLGFSDRATVYLNGRALFRGEDAYRSRDYRFLGTIGWWDTVFLPLEPGENELVVAVSEAFGGWGLQARL
jgi:hypothetical protein